MTSLNYSWVLAISYAMAFAAWLLCRITWPQLWPPAEPEEALDWRELLWVLASLIGVLGVGVLYQRAWLLPAVEPIEPLIKAINQALIFSPFLLMLVLRSQSRQSLWIRTDRIPARLAIGLLLAAVGTLMFTLLHRDADAWLVVVARVYHPNNFGFAVQVLLEDLVIAGLFLRLAGTIGVKAAMAVTGVLFAGGHLPALLAGGALPAGEVMALMRDAGLVIIALSILRRAGDIWWMWMLHFAMDMMQFYSGADLP